MEVKFKVLLMIIFALALTGCSQLNPTATPTPTTIETILTPPSTTESTPPSPTPTPKPTQSPPALGGVFDHFMVINPGETKSASYTFLSGNEQGRVALSISSVSSVFSFDSTEMLEGVNVTIEPSQFTVGPNGVYKAKIVVETDSSVQGVFGENAVGYETVVLLVQAEINGEVVNDWYRIYIDPSDIEVPSLLHVRRQQSTKLEHEESAVIVRSGKVPLRLRTNSVPEPINLTIYRVEEQQLAPSHLDVKINPSTHHPEGHCWNRSQVVINSSRTIGNYTFLILAHYQGGILDASCIEINLKGCTVCHQEASDYPTHRNGGQYCFVCHENDSHGIHTGRGTIGLKCSACHQMVDDSGMIVPGKDRIVSCVACHDPQHPLKPNSNLVSVHLSRGHTCVVCHTNDLKEVHQQKLTKLNVERDD